MNTLTNKIAVVTGGSRGIGRAICLRLAGAGVKVMVNYVSQPDAATETVSAIKANGGEAEIVRFNVALFSEVQDEFKRIITDYGKVDILVNNAGITRDNLLVRMKEEDWDQVVDTNLKGAFHCTKAVTRSMMKQRWGRIVNITSVVGFSGNVGQANYAAAKSGLLGLTRSLARELASRGITVNGVAPGYIATDMTKNLSAELVTKIKSEIPLGLLGEADDIASAVVFLVSDDARYITGEVIHVNGGMFMG